MKKQLIQALTLLLVLPLFYSTVCEHVHTEECGKDGINCQHQCMEIQSYQIEKEKPDL